MTEYGERYEGNGQDIDKNTNLGDELSPQARHCSHAGDEEFADTKLESRGTERESSKSREKDRDREKGRDKERNRDRDRDRDRNRDRETDRHSDRDRDRHRDKSERRDRDRERNDDDHPRSRSYDRRRDYDRDKEDRHRRRSRSRSRSKARSEDRERSRSRSRSRSKSKRISGFDMAPPASALMPGLPAATAVAGLSTGTPPVMTGMLPNMFPLATGQPFGALNVLPQAMTQQATRHARRVYVGGLSPSANEQSGDGSNRREHCWSW